MKDARADILKVYDAVVDASLWPDVLDNFVEKVGAKGSVIFEWKDIDGQNRLTAPLYSGLYSHELLETYLEKCAHLEANDQSIVRAHTGSQDQVEVIDDTVLAKSASDLLKQEHVQRLRKLGIRRRAAGVLNKDNQWLSLFSIQFGQDKQPLDDDNRGYIETLLPHIAKAQDLALPLRQIASISRSVLAATDKLSIGICVLDVNGRLVYKNEEFRRQLDRYPILSLSPRGELKMSTAFAQKQFEVLKSDVRSHGKFGARPRKEALPTEGSDHLCIELTPLNKSEEMGSSQFEGYVLYSTDTSLPLRCNTAPMKLAFGLTDTELAIVQGIGEGLTNPEIAERRDRSVATVNAQVKSILAKSQCATRTQFVRMMMRYGGNYLLD